LQNHPGFHEGQEKEGETLDAFDSSPI